MAFETMALMHGRVVQAKLLELLQQRSGQEYGFDLSLWMQWIWQRDAPLHPQYSDFKASLYGLIGPDFEGYFSSNRVSNIRLTEVVWCGGRQDGIPPLRQPDMVAAAGLRISLIPMWCLAFKLMVMLERIQSEFWRGTRCLLIPLVANRSQVFTTLCVAR